MARQPKLTTKSGMPSGITTRIAKRRRHGRSVRSTNQAASVPTTAHRTVTTTTSDTVFQTSVAVRLPEQELVQLGPAHLDRLDDQEDEREQHDDRDEDGGGGQQRRQGAGRPRRTREPPRPRVTGAGPPAGA